MSFCALESNNDGDNRKWLSYWVIFGLFNGIDHFAIFLLSIRLYYVIKLATLIWLFHPKTQGAS
jgi:receptor expression-enhancing protein 5/6